MSGPDRRTFLKTAGGVLPAAAVGLPLGLEACAPEAAGDGGAADARPDGGLALAPLRAVAEVALPVGALGAEGTEEALRRFLAWVEGFAPAAELDHGYLTGALRYGPPHPGPRWAAQLEAMDLESDRRSGLAFAERPPEERRAVVEDALAGAQGLPGDPAQADHVALGLLAWFYGTSEADDLCYRARVGRHACRGIASLPDEPAAAGEA